MKIYLSSSYQEVGNINNNTIVEVVRDGLCTGCGTCIALCPEEAIKHSIKKDKGIYIPELNNDKCVRCAICYKVCAGHEIDFRGLNTEIFGKEPEDVLIGNYIDCYTGHSTDYDIRYNSTSGGMVTQLLIFALEKGIIDGALVTRMKKEYPLEPEPFIARTREEIIEASKSKYCPVPANIALKEILESKEGDKFAVVGLPCHIHGIRKAERINKKLKEKIILHLGIVCNHTPTFLATSFILKKMNINEDDVINLDYRGEGWPGAMKIKSKGGTLLLGLGEFWSFGQGFMPIRCTFCCDHTAELSDISFADAWIPEMKKIDQIGTSIIIVRRDSCREILRSMANESDISLMPLNSDKVVQSQRLSLHFKKHSLMSRMQVFNSIGKRIPHYDIDGLSDSTWRGYLSGIELYARLRVFSNCQLWRYIYAYLSLKRSVISFLRLIIQRI